MPRTTVSMLKRGMLLDLEGDQYADRDRDHPEYTDSYAVVENVRVLDHTGHTLGVEFRDGRVVNFPHDHPVWWNGQFFYKQQAPYTDQERNRLDPPDEHGYGRVSGIRS